MCLFTSEVIMVNFKTVVQRTFTISPCAMFISSCLSFKNKFPKFDIRAVRNYSIVNPIVTANTNVNTPKKKNIRKKKAGIEQARPGFWNVVAYATAKEYDLRKLKNALYKQNLYIPSDLCCNETLKSGVSNALHAVAQYQVSPENRHIYYFREGSVVMWNFPEVERSSVLSFLKNFEEESYDHGMVLAEQEIMEYTYSTTSKRSYIHEGCLHISNAGRDPDDICLDKYAFSNALSLSVKLGVLETSLEKYIRGIEYITEDLKYGHPIRLSQESVLRRSGELFALRHTINLSTDLLDTPDFYWDHEHLELLYQRFCSYFSITRRTKVMNEKLNHCIELIDLVSTSLSDKHHVRLEWMIIILIMVEVGFEVIHYVNSRNENQHSRSKQIQHNSPELSALP